MPARPAALVPARRSSVPTIALPCESCPVTQRKGFVVRHNYVGSGQGSVCRVVEFAPGGAKFMHRTETLDYAICLKDECDLELDDGRMVPTTHYPTR